MNKYELAVVVSAKLEDEARADVIEKVKALVTRFGGNVTDVDEWGKRRFAYEIQKMKEEGKVTEGVMSRVERGLTAIEKGVNRVHLLDGRMQHALLLEFFSVAGVGTAMIKDENQLYAHEKDED